MPPRKPLGDSSVENKPSTRTRPSRAAASKRSSAASTSANTTLDSDEEEEDVKPVVRPTRTRGGRTSQKKATPTPQPEEPSPVEDEEDEAEEEEETPPPVPSTPIRKTKPLIAPESDEESEDDDEDEEEVEEQLKKGLPFPSSPTPTPAGVAPVEVPDDDEDAPSPEDEKAPAVEPEPVVEPPKVPTMVDLATQARMAAMNHAAMEKEREKEREGKPRLVIHQLVLEDFKSYRGRGVIGPFHKSFSSVVGPNGSGKSNTIDALLFVFGYRATKMRQGKLSELIHNSGPVTQEEEAASTPVEPVEGAEYDDDEEYSSEEDWEAKKKGKKGKGKGKGKKKAPEASTAGLIGSCMVEVWFREIVDLPGDDFTVVPGSQLRVSRTAYRDNSSTYRINGKQATFTQVTTLLKDRGIDIDHNRFLILQGEVESIAQMKPKGATEHDEGLLEYLEDIIGTAKYKKEIELAVVEVERLNDARGVQLNRVKLVEREKSALEGRKKEADAFLRDQNELVHNQSALWQVSAHQARANTEVYKEAVDEAKAELDAEVESQAGTRKEVEDRQKEYDTLMAETKVVEKETNEIVKQLSALERTDVQLQEKKKSLVAKIKKMKKSLTDDTHARSEADTWIRNHGEEIERVRKDLTKMEASLEDEEAELEKVRDSLKGKTEVFSSQIEVLQQDLQPWAEKIAAKQEQIDLLVNDRDMLLEKSESAKAAVQEAEEALEKLSSTEKEESLVQLQAEKKQVEKQVAAATAKLEGLSAEDAKLRSKATAARQKTDEAKASQSASRSQGNVLTSLTKLKDQGRLAGFHGRLGNLGRIDDKYDVAISTACPQLDNLVADSIAVGQACIDHLRKNDLGRANVMCLDSLSRHDMSRIQTPESAPRLFDLITVKDTKFAPAFYQALRNTLVATDLDQGKRLAFGSGNQRWRVVTLDGQLIDVSGTMSGGGGKPKRGGMSSKIAADAVTPEYVAKCEKEQTVAVEALKAFSEDRQQGEKELAALKKRLPDIEMSISKVQMDIKTSGKRMEEAKKRLEELKTQSKGEAADAKEIAKLEKSISDLEKERAQLQKQASAIEDKIKALQEKILEVGGVKLRNQQTIVSDLKARIDHSNDRLTKAEVGKAKSEKDSAKLGKAIDANKSGMETTEAELKELTDTIEAGASESDAVRQAAEQAQENLSTKKDELAEMKTTLDEQLAIMTQFKKREIELKAEVDAQQKLLDEATKAVTHWTEKIGELELNHVVDSDDEDDEAEGEEGKPKEPKAPKERSENDLRTYTEEEIASLDPKALKTKIAQLEERLAKSNLDLAVIQEYARREEEFLKRAADLDEVTKERDGAKKLADDLRGQRLKEFMEGFGIISMKLKEMYQMITLGGNAELELVDSLDPFSEGIIFSVMPPKKSWKNISNLSGGEKTLSSLALVFALHVFKPTPLYFMDEIDAALDFRNVSIVANYIKDRTKNAQFVVISLRNNMFELSSRLLGIYKTNNETRSIAIDNFQLDNIKTEEEVVQEA
ncbi:hypothetical protein MNV49_002349 [Pseudohyphozyma bogoriensis]|nr:hypothetical protein MNV49_002349 [Pseudohyphozyma bogoriensis]